MLNIKSFLNSGLVIFVLVATAIEVVDSKADEGTLQIISQELTSERLFREKQYALELKLAESVELKLKAVHGVLAQFDEVASQKVTTKEDESDSKFFKFARNIVAIRQTRDLLKRQSIQLPILRNEVKRLLYESREIFAGHGYSPESAFLKRLKSQELETLSALDLVIAQVSAQLEAIELASSKTDEWINNYSKIEFNEAEQLAQSHANLNVVFLRLSRINTEFLRRAKAYALDRNWKESDRHMQMYFAFYQSTEQYFLPILDDERKWIAWKGFSKVTLSAYVKTAESLASLRSELAQVSVVSMPRVRLAYASSANDGGGLGPVERPLNEREKKEILEKEPALARELGILPNLDNKPCKENIQKASRQAADRAAARNREPHEDTHVPHLGFGGEAEAERVNDNKLSEREKDALGAANEILDQPQGSSKSQGEFLQNPRERAALQKRSKEAKTQNENDLLNRIQAQREQIRSDALDFTKKIDSKFESIQRAAGQSTDYAKGHIKAGLDRSNELLLKAGEYANQLGQAAYANREALAKATIATVWSVVGGQAADITDLIVAISSPTDIFGNPITNTDVAFAAGVVALDIALDVVGVGFFLPAKGQAIRALRGLYKSGAISDTAYKGMHSLAKVDAKATLNWLENSTHKEVDLLGQSLHGATDIKVLDTAAENARHTSHSPSYEVPCDERVPTIQAKIKSNPDRFLYRGHGKRSGEAGMWGTVQDPRTYTSKDEFRDRLSIPKTNTLESVSKLSLNGETVQFSKAAPIERFDTRGGGMQTELVTPGKHEGFQYDWKNDGDFL